jgi:hypothetical protein
MMHGAYNVKLGLNFTIDHCMSIKMYKI